MPKVYLTLTCFILFHFDNRYANDIFGSHRIVDVLAQYVDRYL